jgi:hypothetical protein
MRRRATEDAPHDRDESAWHGAHSGTFFVPKGVPRPHGTLGHSTLHDFNTPNCTGAGCERD